MKVVDVARVAHEVNRAYCQALGDTSQTEWAEAPEWQKRSAIDGVGFHMTATHSPAASHESWLKGKLDEGWKYGPVKNPDTKEHPCCVPYDQLPKEQQAKDFIFAAVVHSLQRYVTHD
jgi:hypothetical protein